MYLIRLDDASDFMDVSRWNRIERLLDGFGLCPLVGVIPENHDRKLVVKYKQDEQFWDKVRNWERKGWTVALHGWHHVYTTSSGGVNPVNRKSEFAGVSFDKQCQMIREGLAILRAHGIMPQVFFAPSHTYDLSTLEALRVESSIRIISDTVANDVYYANDFYFVPVQSGRPRRLPLRLVTICLHPNMMSDAAFIQFQNFLDRNRDSIISFKELKLKKRARSPWDRLLQICYFAIRRIKLL